MQALAVTDMPVVLAVYVEQDERPYDFPKPRRTEVDSKPFTSQSLRCFNQTALLAVISEAPETVIAILQLAGAVAGISSPVHAHRTLFFMELMCRTRAAALHLPPVSDAFLKTISMVHLQSAFHSDGDRRETGDDIPHGTCTNTQAWPSCLLLGTPRSR
jgi:hypothetical protein